MEEPIDELFVLNPDTFLVEINKEWISTIEELAAIIRRDKGSPGDSQGRIKLRARKDFTFIYHAVSYKSKYFKYKEEEKLKEALKEGDFPPGYNYLQDEVLCKAALKYRQLTWALEVELLDAAQGACHKLTKWFNDVDFDKKDKMGKPIYSTKELRDNTSQIGDLLDGLNSLRTRVMKNEVENLARGGVKIGNRELTDVQRARVK